MEFYCFEEVYYSFGCYRVDIENEFYISVMKILERLGFGVLKYYGKEYGMRIGVCLKCWGMGYFVFG